MIDLLLRVFGKFGTSRIFGVLGLLLVLYGGVGWTFFENAPDYQTTGKTVSNITDDVVDVANLQGRYGIVTLGAALVIVSGGIDLSIGSVVGLSAVLFGVLTRNGVHPYAALPVVVVSGSVVGLGNGLVITRLKIQPFLVTLCGMFVYRGVARLIADPGTVSQAETIKAAEEFEGPLKALRYVLVGKDYEGLLVVPAQFLLLLGLAAVVGFFLHRTAYGRYWYAVGHNEQAAHFAGVNVDRQRTVVYVTSSTLAALAGVLLFLDSPSVQSNSGGEFLELYAVLGAVLGGCSLRGGEGTAVGMVLGAMVLPVLENLVSLRALGSNMIPAVVGLTLLLGTVVDEFIRRRSRVHR